MHCPRLKHFLRLQPSGKIGKCGHMINSKEFDSYQEMQDSQWLRDIQDQFNKNKWPDECKRCRDTEKIYGRSIRLDMIERDKFLKKIDSDYLMLGGVLDNVCNSACQTCNANLSTKIGSLSTKNYLRIDNYDLYNSLPLDRILELDVNGGEPTASPIYKKVLSDPPPNLKIIRINTNGHRTFPEVQELLARGIKVIVTVSFDGTDNIHDYVRWPIKFESIDRTIEHYKSLRTNKLFSLNLWTTVSCLNVNNLEEILSYAESQSIDHEFGLLHKPTVYNISNINRLTVDAKLKYLDHKNKVLRDLSANIATGKQNSPALSRHIESQDLLRGINFKDYFNLRPQDL